MLQIKNIFYYLLLVGTLSANDLMIDRMQSVVDEVIELRANYEKSVKSNQECQKNLIKHSKDIKKISSNEGFDYKEFEKNVKELKALKIKNKTLQDENIKLSYQIDRLRQSNSKSKKLLVEKEKQLIEKIKIKVKTKQKPKTKIVKKKNIKKKTSKVKACVDANKFPKLKMKDENKIISSYAKASAYRLNKSAKIYADANGKVISTWEEKTSFTSYISMGEWIKITGHFVNGKWQRAKKEMWIKSADVNKR